MTNRSAALIYPELSYKIIGAAFRVFNKLGWGHKESTYQKALALEFGDQKIKFDREKYLEVRYDNRMIGREFIDFIVENKIIVETKVAPKLGYIHINQVVSYLKNANLQLAILIYFNKTGVKYRRIINSK